MAGRAHAVAISDLDSRYTPTHHIRTDSEHLLDAVALAESFVRQFVRHIHALTTTARDLVGVLNHSLPINISTAAKQLEDDISVNLPILSRSQDTRKMSEVQTVCARWRELGGKLWELLDHAAGILPRDEESPFNPSGEKFSYEREMIRRFWNKLEALADFAGKFTCADTRRVALLGPAGSGKSHLMANLVRTTERYRQPTLLLLGEYFLSSDEPWGQIIARLGWESDVADLLAALHYEAEVAGHPALLCIDAVNESSDRKLWRSHLQAFAARLAPYSNIRLVISCRKDFAELTLPAAVSERRDASWSFIGHDGFGENIFEAVASYFSGYCIQSRHFPPLLAEFRNPLFLKTFCEAFEGRSLPDGPITLSAVMDARIQKLCDRLQRDIDCPEDTTRRSIAVVAQLIEESRGKPIPRSELRPIVDGLFPGRGDSGSLYRMLRSNGMLVEVAHHTSPSATPVISVRFPFERFSDYFIADRMLSQHADFEALRRTWDSDGTIARFTKNEGYGPLRGLARALAILVPERFGREFVALLPNCENNSVWLEDFLASLSWRSPHSVTTESDDLLRKSQIACPREFLNTLLSIATVPSHPYNAIFLHEQLKRMRLSDRESVWTIPVGQHAIRGGVLLIRWAFCVPLSLVSDEQAGLVARVLAWLCSSNHRALRYRATLAAIRLLKSRARVAAQIVSELYDVNDPYVVERVFAIAAGVAMREHNREALGTLAVTVYNTLFDHDEVPPNILTRDFARCVLEIADQRGVLPEGIDPKGFRPLYRSSWPDIWPESKVTPVEKAEGWYAIASSVQPECTGWYGDFGRYTMQALVSNFSNIASPSQCQLDRNTKRFDPMTARRWVVQRVVELGWTPDRFGGYERSDALLRGRQRVDVERWRHERISKKYQWIALHELAGYLSDHYRMLPDWDGKEPPFAGPWQFFARDFDPSQPFRDLEDSDDEELEEPLPPPAPWWEENYPDPFGNPSLCADPNAWVRRQPADFRALIEWDSIPGVVNEHLALGGSYMWDEPSPLGNLRPRPGRLKFWCHIRTWLVRNEDFESTREAVRKTQFWGEGCNTIELQDRWLGAYPWGEEFADLREYCRQADRWVRDDSMPIEQAVLLAGRDDLSGRVPAPRLLELLGARWSGEDFNFINSSGERVAFCPCTERDEAAGPLFLEKTALIAALRATGWDIIWAVVGDQSCFDSQSSTHVANAELQFSAVYWLEGNVLCGGLTQSDIMPIPRHL